MKCIKCRQELTGSEPTCPVCHTRAHSVMAIGQILVEEGILSGRQLEEVLAVQRRTGRRLGSVLVEAGLVSEKDFCLTLARQLDVPCFDLEDYFVDPAVVALVPEPICERYRMIPLMKVEDRLTVAMMDPTNLAAVEDVELLTSLRVKVVMATPTQILEALAQAFDEIARQNRRREELADSTPHDPGPKLHLVRKTR